MTKRISIADVRKLAAEMFIGVSTHDGRIRLHPGVSNPDFHDGSEAHTARNPYAAREALAWLLGYQEGFSDGSPVYSERVSK